MDGLRFDQWTKQLGGDTSRRTVARLAVGGGLAALGLGLGHEAAHACRGNGEPCAEGNGTKQNRSCCSGTCRRGTCRPAKGAKGCTVRMDICRRPQSNPCPKDENGLCVLLDNGRPFCFKDIACVNCKSGAHCRQLSRGIPGKCVKSCNACRPTSNGRACVYGRRAPHAGAA